MRSTVPFAGGFEASIVGLCANLPKDEHVALECLEDAGAHDLAGLRRRRRESLCVPNGTSQARATRRDTAFSKRMR